MKTIVFKCVFCLCLIGICISCKHHDYPQTYMKLLSSTVTMQDIKSGVLVENNMTDSVVLTFSDNIDMSTVTNNIILNKYNNPQIIFPCEYIAGKNANQVLLLLNGSQFDSIGHYSLHISTELKSTDGKVLQEPYEGYFVLTPYSNSHFFDYNAYTAIISDIHMGDERSIDQKYGWFIQNKSKLLDFLNYIIYHKWYYKELIIAGDLFDEWVAPMDVLPFGTSSGSNLTESEFALKIAEANKDIIDKIKEVTSNNIKVTYVPGNHDMLVTSDDIDAIFGAGVVNQARDANGLGSYSPSHDLIVEHGHRYDFFNAPDPLSNIGIENVTTENAILPSGFFVTKYATSSDIANNPTNSGQIKLSLQDLHINPDNLETELKNDGNDVNNILYTLGWSAIILSKPLKNGLELPIKTGLAGYSNNYTVKQVSPLDLQMQLLYKDAANSDKWRQRLTANRSVYIPFTAGLLAGANGIAYPFLAAWAHTIQNDKRIVVFGHTHEADLQYIWTSNMLYSGIYANAGTWVDKKYVGKDQPTCTFVEIYEGSGILSNYKQIQVKEFKSSSDIRNIKKPLWIYTKNE